MVKPKNLDSVFSSGIQREENRAYGLTEEETKIVEGGLKA
jgi:hypothetical protein